MEVFKVGSGQNRLDLPVDLVGACIQAVGRDPVVVWGRIWHIEGILFVLVFFVVSLLKSGWEKIMAPACSC